MMNELPKTMTQTMWVGINERDGKPSLMTYNMSGFGTAMLGQVEVTFDVPQVDALACKIDALQKKRQELLAESEKRLNWIDEQIRELQAIEYKPASA